MSEELNRRDAELNEKALENVSGGRASKASEALKAHAAEICQSCPTRRSTLPDITPEYLCTGGEAALAEAMSARGYIYTWHECRFLKKP